MVAGMVKPIIDVFPVFIGWDSREPEAAEVTKSSLIKHASIPIYVQMLKERMLRHNGLYQRRWHTDGEQKIDKLDGKPFSTEFSFDRFLIPALTQWSGWALFLDCDFLVKADIARLVEELDDKYAVMVCKQNYVSKTDVKMDGQKQQTYFRKNWSSFCAFNCSHPTNLLLTVDAVNNEPGNWLHSFGWVPDGEIGNLDHRWNWIAGTTEGNPLAIHYTLGGPWFRHMQNVPYADEWIAEATRIGVWNEAA
jgi:hypothetical protein